MKFYHHAFAAAVVVVSAAAAQAVSPSAALFKSTNVDFGTVARAAKTEHRFEFTNPFDQPIHISGVRASCGCTTPIVETKTVAPGQTGSILARFNTGTFTGARSATLTVSFDRPSYSEVQLHVKGYIRSDVVFNPGEANFGTIAEGEGKKIKMTVDYAGRNDWAILGIKSGDTNLKARAEEGKRTNGRVSYDLELELAPNAPVGALLSEIVIQTNDKNLKTIPLVVTGKVEASISVSPQQVEISQDANQQVVILKGQNPFKIVDVTSEEFDVEFGSSEDSKQVHSLPLTLKPKNGDKSVEGQIMVKTDSDAMPVIKLNAIYNAKK